jgi:hypothetical protein
VALTATYTPCCCRMSQSCCHGRSRIRGVLTIRKANEAQDGHSNCSGIRVPHLGSRGR